MNKHNCNTVQLPASAKVCFAFALLVLIGGLLVQVLPGAIAEQLRMLWERGDGWCAILALILAAELAIVVQ